MQDGTSGTVGEPYGCSVSAEEREKVSLEECCGSAANSARLLMCGGLTIQGEAERVRNAAEKGWNCGGIEADFSCCSACSVCIRMSFSC